MISWLFCGYGTDFFKFWWKFLYFLKLISFTGQSSFGRGQIFHAKTKEVKLSFSKSLMMIFSLLNKFLMFIIMHEFWVNQCVDIIRYLILVCSGVDEYVAVRVDKTSLQTEKFRGVEWRWISRLSDQPLVIKPTLEDNILPKWLNEGKVSPSVCMLSHSEVW